MAVNLGDYLKRIRPHVKGCPDVVMEDSLRIILRDTCYRTNLWQHEESVYLVKEVDEYELVTPADAEIATVQSLVRPDGFRLQSQEPLPVFLSAGSPRHFRHKGGNQLAVSPVPATDGLYTLHATLMPTLTAGSVPDEVYSATAEFVPWGVLAELQMIQDESWHNPQQADYNRRRYEKGVYRKRIRALVGVSGGSQTIKRRRFV